ncbi:hypothetical protein, partial [Foetidibacter luteolus]|uniref:hypothetical protein n=1 Tax=Foetidibacter luteolus TaxID=2608880 RepID=UPI001A987CCC
VRLGITTEMVNEKITRRHTLNNMPPLRGFVKKELRFVPYLLTSRSYGALSRTTTGRLPVAGYRSVEV